MEKKRQTALVLIDCLRLHAIHFLFLHAQETTLFSYFVFLLVCFVFFALTILMDVFEQEH